MSELEIKDRILRILTTEKISSSKFADKIGVQRSSISHILSGRNKPSLDFLQKVLSNFPNIDSGWLITGSGEMFKHVKQVQLDFDTDSSKTVNNVNEPPIETKSISSTPIQNTNPIIQIKRREIKKIVVFYNDNTFEELQPELKKVDS